MIWKERFPVLAEQIYSEYNDGDAPNLAYTTVSRKFNTRLQMEGHSRRSVKSASMRGSMFLAMNSGEPTFLGEGIQEEEGQNRGSKRRRATTTTGSGPNKKSTRKGAINQKPCVACGISNHTIKKCWLVTGVPEDRYVPENKKKEFEKRRKTDTEFEKLVQEVLRLDSLEENKLDNTK